MPTPLNYNRDIPDAPNKPSVDQPKMKTNTNSIDTLLAVDHVSFGPNTNGYHTIIHEVTQVADPAPVALFNQIYSKNYTPDTASAVADTQLFTMTALGIISQLTGYSDDTDGWQWIGGVLIQWGAVTFGSSTDHLNGTVTFKNRIAGAIPFPNNCFVVIGTLKVASTTTTIASNTLSIREETKTTFRWLFNSSSSSGSAQHPGFYWVAIGN